MKRLVFLATLLLTGWMACAADVSYTLDKDGMPSITLGGKKLFSSSMFGFNKGWAWVSAGQKLSAGNGLIFSCDAMKVVATGKWTFEDNKMSCTYKFKSKLAIPDMIGLGYQFNPILRDPMLGGQDNKPELLPDNTGWQWEFAPGQVIKFSFTPKMAQVFFEMNNPGQIRCYFYAGVAGGIEPGTKEITMTIEMPKGSVRVPTLAERYGEENTANWYRNPLDLTQSMVDLSSLNEKPAGKFGFVNTDNGEFVFDNGKPVRFWGCNVQAYSLYIKDKPLIKAHAKRIAQLGFNLVRLHHHDSKTWVRHCVIADGTTSQEINQEALDSYFYWIKCLKDEGIYIWVDLHAGRPFVKGDEIPGFDELLAVASERHKKQSVIEGKGYCFINDRITELMQLFNEKLLTTVNPHTGLALKDDPAIMGVLLSNENDLTTHFAGLLLSDKVPQHKKKLQELADLFVAEQSVSPTNVLKFWEPGDGKLFFNDVEAKWNVQMIEHLKKIGVKVPICAAHIWGGQPMSSLPSMTVGDMLDMHNYEAGEFLDNNPRYTGNFMTSAVRSHVAGKPVCITEYNGSDHNPIPDVFTIPLYAGAISAFQGINAPMLFAYAQDGLENMNPQGYLNNAYKHPGLMSLYPAAALLYRRDVQQAKETWYAKPDVATLIGKVVADSKSFTSLQNLHRVLVAMPAVEELPWLKATQIPAEAKTFENMDQDFIPAGQNYVTSDTGELTHDWGKGIFTVNTPKSQGVTGWLKEAGAITLKDVTIISSNPKASIVLSSLDDQPIEFSGNILVSVAARYAQTDMGNGVFAFICEPVKATLQLKGRNKAKLIPLNGEGSEGTLEIEGVYDNGILSLTLPEKQNTSWYLIK